MAGLIVETSFLIDLEREAARDDEGAAHRFLRGLPPSTKLFVTFTVAGELAAGRSMAQRTRWSAFVDRFRVLPSTVEVCWQYGNLYRFLQRNGLLLDTNDLWIAATALAYGMPLVTRNIKHFQRVPDLEIVEYA